MNSLERSFERTPQSVGQARGFVTFAVGCLGDTARSEDICSCVSEMASNVLLHTREITGGFTVRVCGDQHGCVRLEVHDHDHDAVAVSARKSPGDDATEGRGMFIVEHLSDDWGVEKSPTGKLVWSHFSAISGETHEVCDVVSRGTPSIGQPRPPVDAEGRRRDLTNVTVGSTS
ncbi:ATP-binding protein [Streptomyces nigra]|uniref:ATP-binding protein n=1 Tax=Streptomyces nigra TaxID=1827580 RepID=UPI003686924D